MGTWRSGEVRGGRKWFLGCCGGCLGFIVVVVVAVGILAYFAARSMPVLPPETFLDSRADALFLVRISPDDEGLVSLVKDMVENPPTGKKLTEEQVRSLRQLAGRLKGFIERFFPVNLVVTVRHDAEREKFIGSAVVSIKAWSGFARWILSAVIRSLPEEGGEIVEYKAVKVGRTKDGICLAVKENNFMLLGDMDTAKEWIDRIERQKELALQAAEGEPGVIEFEGQPLLKEMYTMLDQSAALRFASLNSHGEIGALLASLEKKQEDEKVAELVEVLREVGLSSPEVLAISGYGRIVSAQEAKGKAYVRCGDEAFAEKLLSRLEEVKSGLAEESSVGELELGIDGSTVSLSFSLQELREKLKALQEGSEDRRPLDEPDQEGPADASTEG